MVSLAPLTTLRLGGPARRLVRVATADELVATVRELDAAGEPVLLLAGGSNVVVSDAGFDGTVVRIETRGIERDGATLTVEAGEEWDAVVRHAVAGGLAGVECLSGIPGSTGATPIQNVGAYGQDVSQTIASVRVLDRRSGEVADLPPRACGFAYRSSAFKGRDGPRRARRHVRAARVGPGRAGRLRGARTGAGRRARRPCSAGRRPQGGAGAAPREGHGHRRRATRTP